jgi:rhodanese-related sulfurtransferase
MMTLFNPDDYKKITNNLPGIVISAVVLIILGLILVKPDKFSYKISTEEMLNKVLETKHTITPEKFSDIYFTKDSTYRFIDLRSSADYLEGHIENAIHIPLHKILDDNYLEIFNQDTKINILYHSDHCRACGPWMILTQLGYKNNKILLGGYDNVKMNIIDDYSPMSGNFSEEKAKYDYSKIFNSISGSTVKTEVNSEQNPATTPQVKKKKKSSSGGC